MKTTQCSGPVNRREFMRVGALAVGGLTLAEVMAGRAAAGASRKDTSVILIYLNGGPSHMETYDLKPEAPLAYRSVFPAIKTNVPGIELCELFPLQAKLADKFAIVRSCHHMMASHSDGGIQVMTGKTPPLPDPTSQSKSAHPDIGHVASKFRGLLMPTMPAYVSTLGRVGHTRPNYIGVEHGSLTSAGNSPLGRMATGRDGEGLNDRRSLLKQFDNFRHGLDLRGNVAGTDGFRQQVIMLVRQFRHRFIRRFAFNAQPVNLPPRLGVLPFKLHLALGAFRQRNLRAFQRPHQFLQPQFHRLPLAEQ